MAKKVKVSSGEEVSGKKKKSARQDGFIVYERLSGIRANPTMYLGNLGHDMAYRVIKEEVDNAYDEAVAGRNKLIEVILDYDADMHVVADAAGGIPTDFKTLSSGEKETIMTAAFTRTHAGGKFNSDAYKTSCFTGDTRIRLLDGTIRTMEWLAENYYDQVFWVYSCTPEGFIVPGKAFFPRLTKSTDELYEVTLDNGQKERCTGDHRWMLRDGSYCHAQDLVAGTSLMPLYTKFDDQGHVLVRLNNLDQPHLRREGERQRNRKFMYAPMYRMVYAHTSDAERKVGFDIHHANFNPEDDRPENLVRIKKTFHRRLHSKHGQRTGELSAGLVKYNKSDRGRATSSRIGKENSKYLVAFNNSIEGKKASSEKMRNINKLNILEQQRGRVFKAYLYITSYLGLKFTRDTYGEYKLGTTRNWNKLRELFVNVSDIQRNVEDYLKRKRRSGVKYEQLMADYHKKLTRKREKFGNNNHKVVRVKQLFVKSVPVYDISVEKYHNFALDSGVFVHNSGTHGVGVAAVNAVCDELRVWSNYNGKCAFQSYSKGEITTKGPHPVKVKGIDKDVLSLLTKKPKTYGTIIAGRLDQSVVSENARRGKDLPKNYVHAEPQAKPIAKWLKNMANLNPGLEIRFSVIKKGKRKDYVFLNKKDLAWVPKAMCEDRELGMLGKPLTHKSDHISCTVVWSDHVDADNFLTFVNTSPTVDGGWHVTGFTAALATSIKDYMPTKKGKAKGLGFTQSDLLIGLVGMFDWRMHGAQYTSQVKDKLASKVDREVYDEMLPVFVEYFKKNAKVAKAIIKRAQVMNKGRADLAAVVKSMVDVKKKAKGSLLPASLAVANRAKPHERELYIVEGDSAAGTATDARNSSYQEVMSAGGKPLNALEAPLSKVLAHEEIQNMMICMGADVRTLDPKAENPVLSTDGLRTANIIFLVDPDPDGGHIAVLFLAAIYRLLPDLYREGRVWCVEAPLYAVLHQGKLYGGMTYDECRAKAPKAVKDKDITRIKGWGEVDETYLEPIAFDPKLRKLIRINPFADVESEKYFRGIVAGDAVYRRRLLGLDD